MQKAKAGYLRNQELDDELIGQVVEYMVSLDAGSRMASRDPRVRFDRNRAFYTIKRALNRLVKKNQIVPEQRNMVMVMFQRKYQAFYSKWSLISASHGVKSVAERLAMVRLPSTPNSHMHSI